MISPLGRSFWGSFSEIHELTLVTPARISEKDPQKLLEVRPETVTVGEHFVVTLRDKAGHIVTDTLAAWQTGVQKIFDGTVYVKSVLPEDTTLYIPKPIRPSILIRPFDWVPWVYAAAILVLLGIGYWLWTRLRKGVHKPVDPYKAAKREFAKINQLRLLESGDTKKYVTLMLRVVRKYLSATNPALILSRTSQELLSTMKAGDLKLLLESADKAKFAPEPVSPSEAKRIGSEAVYIVDAMEKGK